MTLSGGNDKHGPLTCVASPQVITSIETPASQAGRQAGPISRGLLAVVCGTFLRGGPGIHVPSFPRNETHPRPACLPPYPPRKNAANRYRVPVAGRSLNRLGRDTDSILTIPSETAVVELPDHSRVCRSQLSPLPTHQQITYWLPPSFE